MAFLKSFRKLTLVLLLLVAAPAYAGSGITYQGRILKPDGSPLNGATVQFKMQLRTPGSESCLLFEEVQNADMRLSNGNFSLTINDGTGSRSATPVADGLAPAVNLGLDRIFANRGGFTFPAGACASGTAYAPNPDDGRSLAVLFKDETMAGWEQMPLQKVNYVPFAFESKQVQGFTAASLMRVQEVDGTMGNVSPLSNAEFTKLRQLSQTVMSSGQVLGWNGTTWASVDPLSGVSAFARTALPTCAGGAYLRNNGSGALECTVIPTSGGTVTQVNTGTGLTGGGFTTTGTISIAAGGVTATELATDSVIAAKIQAGAVDSSKLAASAVTTAKLADGSVSNVKLADGSVDSLKLAADAVTSAKIADGSITGADLANNISVNTSGTLSSRGLTIYPNPTGTFGVSFAAPSGLAANYTLTWPLGQSTGSQVLANDGSGNLSWTSLAAASQWTTHGSNISYDGAGNVGIGTTSPTSPLHVVGNIYSSSSVISQGATQSGSGTALNPGHTFINNSNSGMFSPSAGQLALASNGTERMRFDASGNVGVGTTAPATKFEVAGSMRVGDGAETCSTVITGAIRYSGGNLQFCNGTPPWSTLGVAGSGLTALTGDVTATGSGSVTATVASVGGVTAANVATGANLANAATAANTASTIVKRDGSGKVTLTQVQLLSTAYNTTGSFLVDVRASASQTASYNLTWPLAGATVAGQALTSDTSGQLSWTTISGTPTGAAGGDLASTYPNPTVATVGGSTAANVNTATLAANAATALNTSNTIVKRGASGEFAAGVVTANGVTLNNGGSLLNITNPIGGAWSMVLPATAGSSGQVLSTNGAGVTNWVTQATSPWTVQAPGINYMSGNVGIGTTSATSTLDVNGSIKALSVVSAGQVQGAYMNAGSIGTGGDSGTFNVYGGGSNRGGQIDLAGSSASTNPNTMIFRTGTGVTPAERMRIDALGNVGIGTTSPTSALHVVGDVRSTTNFLITGFGGITTTAGYGAGLNFGTGGSTPVSLSTGAVERMRIDPSGNVGIGTTAPATKLEVAGSLRVGDGAETCSAAITGAIRYNGGNLQFCNGTPPWSTLGVAGSGITALTGDVTASGSGSVTATVATVGGVTAANVATGANLANAATSANTNSAIMRRDTNGDFSASSASLSGAVIARSHVLLDTAGTKSITMTAPTTVSTSYTLTWPAAVAGSSGQVLTSSNTGALSWTTPSTSPTGTASGDLSGTYPGPTVATVGGSTAANVNTATVAANAATALNTSSTIVKRGSAGEFAAGVVTANGLTLNNGGSLLNITNPTGGAWNMTLPATAGASGQILTTDGSGLLSWTTPAGGSQWSTQAPGINYTSGNVGIGTTSAATKLEIRNTSNTPPSALVTVASRTTNGALTDTNALMNFYSFNGSNQNSWAVGMGSNTWFGHPDNFGFRNTTYNRTDLTIDSSGKVGVGTTIPNGQLDVKGSIVMSGATSGYSGFQVPAAAGSMVYTMPSAIPSVNGQVLSSTTSGVMSWITPPAGGITALTGDVTATGSGSVAATVATVGGVTAANVATGANSANAATDLNTASTIVKRDASGNFVASKVTATTQAVKDSGSVYSVNVVAPSLAANWTMTLPTLTGSNGQVLTTNGSGVTSWTTPSTAPTGAASGDLSGTYPGPTVATVGGSTAVNVNLATVAANLATAVNTSSTIVKRGSSGEFAAGVATVNGLTLNNGGSALSITNPIGGAWSMVLPATAGSSGQVLSTNGSGVTSWVTPSGGSQWTTQAPGINYTAGNVGIGTTSASQTLDVNGAIAIKGFNAIRLPADAGPGSSIALLPGAANSQTSSASDNISIGSYAGQANTNGSDNIAIGATSLWANNGGGDNIAIGRQALNRNTASTRNVAVGSNAGFGWNGSYASTDNVFVGYNSGYGVITGSSANTFLGSNSGTYVTSGANNTLIGQNTGATLTTGSNTILIGRNADTPAAGTSNFINIGNALFATGASGTLAAPAGNIGIGTTAPGSLLSVGSAGVRGVITLTGSSSASPVMQFDNSPFGGKVYSIYNGSASTNTFSIFDNTASVHRLAIDTNGNVGIGTTAPGAKLDVNGAMRLLGSTSGYVGFQGAAAAGSTTYTWPAADGTSGQVLSTNASGALSWTTPSGGGISSLTGDVTATGSGSVAATVASVGGSTAANVNTATVAANAATAANTVSTIVKRGAAGEFAAGAVTANSVLLNNAGSLVTLQNPAGSSYTLTLPTSAGSASQVLSTNGSGVLSWVAQSAGTGDFKSDGSVAMTGDFKMNAQTIGGGVGFGCSGCAAYGTILPYNSATASMDFNSQGYGGGNEGYNFYVAGNSKLKILANGNVGIGTTSAAAKVTIAGDIRLNGSTSGSTTIKAANSGSALSYTLPSAAPTAGQVLTSTAAGVMSWTTVSGGGGTIDALTDAYTTATSLYMGTGAGAAATSVQSVGVGVQALNQLTTGKQNTAVGYYAGTAVTTQIQNTFIGWQTGWALKAGTGGSSNTMVGNRSGFSNSTTLGQDNAAVGEGTLYDSGASFTTALGSQAGYAADGNYNVSVGYAAGTSNSGSYNTSVGYNAGYNLSGANNVNIGQQAMFSNGAPQSGARNTVVGDFAMGDNSTHTGTNNAVMGYSAGNLMTTGSNNVVLGSSAASNLTTGSNNIIIGATTTAKAANAANYLNIGNTIYGDLSSGNVGIGTTAPSSRLHVVGPNSGGNPVIVEGTPGTGASGYLNILLNNKTSGAWKSGMAFQNNGTNKYSFGVDYNGAGVNDFSFYDNVAGATRLLIDATGNVGIGTTSPSQKLEVNGSVLATAYLYTSDKRLKTNFSPLKNSLEKITKLDTVTFDWITPRNEDEQRKQIGLIAQDVQAQFPEAVTQDKQGWLRLNYMALVSPIIASIKELYADLTRVEERTKKLESTVADLKSVNNDLKSSNEKLAEMNRKLEERLNKIEDRLNRAPTAVAKPAKGR